MLDCVDEQMHQESSDLKTVHRLVDLSPCNLEGGEAKDVYARARTKHRWPFPAGWHKRCKREDVL